MIIILGIILVVIVEVSIHQDNFIIVLVFFVIIVLCIFLVGIIKIILFFPADDYNLLREAKERNKKKE